MSSILRGIENAAHPERREYAAGTAGTAAAPGAVGAPVGHRDHHGHHHGHHGQNMATEPRTVPGAGGVGAGAAYPDNTGYSGATGAATGNNYTTAGATGNNYGHTGAATGHNYGATGTAAGTGAGLGAGAMQAGALPGPAPNTAGPHRYDILNKLDPAVDHKMTSGTTVAGTQPGAVAAPAMAGANGAGVGHGGHGPQGAGGCRHCSGSGAEHGRAASLGPHEQAGPGCRQQGPRHGPGAHHGWPAPVGRHEQARPQSGRHREPDGRPAGHLRGWWTGASAENEGLAGAMGSTCNM